jgi:molybdopterin synthase catalytic subunit
MPRILLTGDALNPGRVVALVSGPAFGAVVTFFGSVRDNSRGQRVRYLEYEAYRPLAEREMERICLEAERRWSVVSAIEHRLGRVDIGEASVAIAVASAHRADAFEACRWLMDSLKADVPIWKKEYFDTGSRWIEGSDVISAGEP